jgi:group I intron endonuclease
MANYDESKIYKIYSNLLGINEIYVGSSANFVARCDQHKSDCYNINSPRYIYKLYNYIRSNGGFNNFIIEEIEHYSCNNRTELNIREEYWKNQLNPTLNIIKAHTTKEELKQYKKDYQQQERIKLYLKTIITCPKCNKNHTRRDTTHHQKTKYCKNFK